MEKHPIYRDLGEGEYDADDDVHFSLSPPSHSLSLPLSFPLSLPFSLPLSLSSSSLFPRFISFSFAFFPFLSEEFASVEITGSGFTSYLIDYISS